jgi:tetratricopeptide (TPR) repeat protein
MKLRFAGILFFLSFLCTAQDVDSLIEQYQTYSDDTTKIALLFNKGFAFRNTDLVSAGKFAQACYETAVQVKDHKYLAKALNFRGTLKAQTGFYKEAAVDLERVLLLLIQTKDTLNQVPVLNNLGNVYTELKEDAKALACFERSLQLANSADNDYWVKGNLLGIATLQFKTGYYIQAEGNYKTLLDRCDLKTDQEIISICELNLGMCYLHIGDTLAAEAYELQALDEMQMMEDTLGACDVYAKLAEIYFVKNDLQQCFTFSQKALAIAQQNNYNEGLLSVWKVLSSYYNKTGNNEEAYFYLNKHDSALSANNDHANITLAAIWNKNETDMILTEASFYYSFKNIMQLIIIVSLFLLIIVVFKKFGDEQKA